MLEVVLIVASLGVWCLAVALLIRRLITGGATAPRRQVPEGRAPSLRAWQVWLQSGGESRHYDRRSDGT